jgi:hypothetical protein
MHQRSPLRDGFLNLRVLVGFVLSSVGVFLALIAFGLYPEASLLAREQQKQIVVHSSHNDVSAPLREMATWALPTLEAQHEGNENPPIGIIRASGSRPDPVVQKGFTKNLLASIIPGLNFDGIPYPGVVCNCAPPDTNGYVGLTQYVQIVNEGYQVFDKATGNSVLGPASIRSVWAGFGGVCETGGSGDPVVLYDKLADRWLISQFAASGSINQECIAVSTTSDATGTWNRYDFSLIPFGNNFYDYPKLGSWPDAYYMADNVFNTALTAYLGTQPFAFDRAKMLAGLPATVISPGLIGSPANNEDPVIPSDFDGKILPPAGAPNTFVEFPDSTGNNNNTYRSWHYSVGVPFGTSPSFTQVASPPAAPFSFLFATVPQLPPQTNLDNLADRLMFRLAYRNFGSPTAPDESLVVNYTVSSGGVAGIRWVELKNPTNGPLTVKQESTYQPDTTWRWMGSVAMDQAGNLALGFSASDATIHPQIRYATRLATDPLNTLTAEAHLFDGTGSQSATSSRWGDYSAMTVDPVDDCTFWYTQEYYATNSSFNWRTRIGSFKFDSCGGGGGNIVLQARVQTQGNQHRVQLRWDPADGGTVNILRNGASLGTTADDGNAVDKTLGTQTGSFTYQVCETDSGDCSNEVTVQIP